jgi:hypothetical protein
MIGRAMGRLVKHRRPIGLCGLLQDNRLQRAFDRISPDVLRFEGKSQNIQDSCRSSEPLKSHLQKVPSRGRLHQPAPDIWPAPRSLIFSRNTRPDNPIPFVPCIAFGAPTDRPPRHHGWVRLCAAGTWANGKTGGASSLSSRQIRTLARLSHRTPEGTTSGTAPCDCQ